MVEKHILGVCALQQRTTAAVTSEALPCMNPCMNSGQILIFNVQSQTQSQSQSELQTVSRHCWWNGARRGRGGREVFVPLNYILFALYYYDTISYYIYMCVCVGRQHCGRNKINKLLNSMLMLTVIPFYLPLNLLPSFPLSVCIILCYLYNTTGDE